MGWYPPPDEAPGTPVVTVVEAGSTLYRVHSAVFGGDQLNPTDPDSHDAGGGGRFDSPGGDPPFLYAARSSKTAIAESLLRDVPFDELGRRELPRYAISGRCLSELSVERGLKLVSLHGEGLSRIGQDAWLTRCDARDYSRTREWGARMLHWFPDLDGLEWRPRGDDDGLSVCLYASRAAGKLSLARRVELWQAEGLAAARAALLPFGVLVPLMKESP